MSQKANTTGAGANDTSEAADKIPAEIVAGPVAEIQKQEIGFQWRTALHGHYFFLVAALLLLVFGALTVAALGLEPLAFDVPVTHELQEMQWGWFDGLMVAVSQPGFYPWPFIIPIVVAAVLVVARLPWQAAWVALATVLGASAEVVKLFVQRPRPSPDLVSVFSPLNSYSFPSGHVTSYTIFYGFIFYLAFSGLKRSLLRTAILIVTGGLVLLVGPSRVWMGQHWASDALGGYTLGFFLLLVLVRLHRGWSERRLQAAQTEQ